VRWAFLALGSLVASALAWHTYMAYWGAARIVQRIEGPGGTVEVWASPSHTSYDPIGFVQTCLGDLTDNTDISVLLKRSDGSACSTDFIGWADLPEDHVPMKAEWSETEVRLTEPHHRDSLTVSLHGPCKTVFDWQVM
jgi:hypothetical protein